MDWSGLVFKLGVISVEYVSVSRISYELMYLPRSAQARDDLKKIIRISVPSSVVRAWTEPGTWYGGTDNQCS